jgi:hypothetical protein
MTASGPNQCLDNRTVPWKVVLWAYVAFYVTGCGGPVSDAPIIRRYVAATCIPVSINRKVGPDTRRWDTMLTLHNGSTVLVSGMQMPGGRIGVRDCESCRESIAADAGDYVYPSDVRVDRQNDHLYVKASGLAGGIQHQTWLFDYDLRGQRAVARLQVLDDALPPECPELPARH